MATVLSHPIIQHFMVSDSVVQDLSASRFPKSSRQQDISATSFSLAHADGSCAVTNRDGEEHKQPTRADKGHKSYFLYSRCSQSASSCL